MKPEFIKIASTRELPQDKWMELASACRDREEAVLAFKSMRGIEPATIYEYEQDTGMLYFTESKNEDKC